MQVSENHNKTSSEMVPQVATCFNTSYHKNHYAKKKREIQHKGTNISYDFLVFTRVLQQKVQKRADYTDPATLIDKSHMDQSITKR